MGDHALGTCGQQRPGALGTSGNCGIPTKAYDRNGIFSGSALEIDGKLHLYYTAVRYLESNEEDIHCSWNDCYEASQAMITSEDGRHFDNWKDKRQIIPVITDEEKGDTKDTRS